MTTQQQIEANRQNAKLGGVKTEEGKEISKYNALKHGLLSKEVLLEKEDEQNLVELGKRLRNELKPAGELEVLLADRIVANFWRLRRALEVEKNAMEWRKNYKEISFGLDEEPESQKKKKQIKAMIVNDDMENYSAMRRLLKEVFIKPFTNYNGYKPPVQEKNHQLLWLLMLMFLELKNKWVRFAKLSENIGFYRN